MPARLLRVAFYFIRPFLGLFSGILVVTCVTSLLESLNLATFLPLFHSLWNADAPASAGRLQATLLSMSRLLPFPDPIVSSAVLIVVVVCLKSGMGFVREALIAQGSGRVLHDAKRQLIERYHRSGYPFFLETKQGTLLYNSVLAPGRVALLAFRLPQFAAEALKVIAILALLCLIWPTAALGLVGLVVVYNWFSHVLSRRISYTMGRGRAEADAEQTALCNEFFTGIRQIMAFRTGAYWVNRYQDASKRSAAFYTKDVFLPGLMQNVTELTAVLLLVGLVVWLKWSAPELFYARLPVVGVFALSLLRLLPSVTYLGRQRMEMMTSLADAERVYETLMAPEPSPEKGTRVFEALRSGVVLTDVSFSHQGREPLLSHLDMTIARGTVTAIVGPSGSGKSTLINLLLGLFDPNGGQILVDDVPLPAYTRESWLGQIGFVSQDSFIFHGTVSENILFGRSGFTREDVVRAAHISNAHAFVSALPQGYDTVVGERGMKLSGGQQQRIAIARAMLGNPQLLIFDEATSHLDTIAEQQVQEAIDRVSKDRTVLLIAHRLSTVRHADHIVVLDQGHIVEQGSHEELLGERGRYFHLVESGTG